MSFDTTAAKRALIARLSAEAKAAERTELLYRLDLIGVDLSGIDLTWIAFDHTPLRTLLRAGLSPRALIQHRWSANRQLYAALHFCAQAVPGPHIRLTAKECTRVCQACQEVAWDDLTDERVFAVLYPQEPWATWMGRVASREILNWALAHRAFLEAYYPRRDGIPFYGRVLPVHIVDEVQPADLVAGMKTDPERLFYAVGLRQVVKQSDLQGEEVAYPPAGFADGPGVTQIRSRRALQIEGGLMRHCVASYDRECLTGETSIYHVGDPAPYGSTLELSPQGRVLQHRAFNNAWPSREDQALLDAWLESRGLVVAGATGSLHHICQILSQAGIARVTWEVYWYDDQNTSDDLECFDAEDEGVALPRGITEEDVMRLSYDAGFDTGRFELDVQTGQVEWTGEPRHSDEEEDAYDDESTDDDMGW